MPFTKSGPPSIFWASRASAEKAEMAIGTLWALSDLCWAVTITSSTRLEPGLGPVGAGSAAPAWARPAQRLRATAEVPATRSARIRVGFDMAALHIDDPRHFGLVTS